MPRARALDEIRYMMNFCSARSPAGGSAQRDDQNGRASRQTAASRLHQKRARETSAFLQRLLLRPRKTAEYCDEPLSLSVLSHSSKSTLLTVLLTLCGLTSRKTHRGGLGLSGSVHKGAQPV